MNDYLDQFKIPSTYPVPVTLRHLLTHTAGFDDRNIGYVARDAAEVLPLREYLRRALPARVMVPGRFISYSNQGFGLAGHLVELASGQEFSDYLERNILRVLGMNNSTAFTPPPPALASHMATMYSYDARSHRYEPVAPKYRNIPPAGTAWATGTDMSRFLLAHLQGGANGSGRIVKAETINRMHTRQFSEHPRLSGFAFRFYKTAFETACRHAKLSDVTPHVLRHTFASRLVMRGADLRTVQELGRLEESGYGSKVCSPERETQTPGSRTARGEFPYRIPYCRSGRGKRDRG